MSDLFRPEAVEHATRRLPGEVVIVAPLSLVSLSLASLSVIAVLAGIASAARFPRIEVVQGWVVPERGLLRLATTQSGIVESVSAAEGAAVVQGQPIAKLRLATTLASTDLRSLEASFDRETVAGNAEALALRARLETHRRELTSKRTSDVAQLAELRAQIQTAETRLKLSETAAARKDELRKRGLATITAVEDERAIGFQAAKDASEARQQLLEKQQEIRSIDLDLAQVPSDIAALDAQTAQKQSNALQRSLAQKRADSATIAAPVGGKIVAIPIAIGQTVDPGGTVALLTPMGSSLMAELYIPSRAAGFVEAGQRVKLRYQAFPYQTYGAGDGQIVSISRTVLAPKDVPYGSASVTEPVFRARVKLRRQDVSAYGRNIPLQPGMSLTANIIIDRRPLFKWIFDPILAAGSR